MKSFIFRPSIDNYTSKQDTLENLFENYNLVDKTICGNEIVYVFSDEPKIK